MHKKTYLVVLIVLLSFIGFAKEIPSTKKESNKAEDGREYVSPQKEGHIGVFEAIAIDSPVDNVFTIAIDSLPALDEQAWLSYELYGISDHTGISRSINNQLSVGGHFVIQSNMWQHQDEPIKNEWLIQGDNIIRFTLPEQASYNYSIRNLKINIKKTDNKGRAIVLNQPLSKPYASNMGYLNGFIVGKDSELASVFIDGTAIKTLASEFETLIPKQSKKNVWGIIVKAIFPDGEILERQVEFNKNIQEGFYNTIERRSLDVVVESYIPEEEFFLESKGAQINLQPEALKQPTTISITPLRNIDLPTLDPGMVNVTKKGGGYRFLPHGTTFDNEAVISLEYDLDKLPEGYTEADIKTYYFDEMTKHWVALPKASLDQENNRILSKTAHFTDMINGILKVPESPQTTGYMPTSLKDIKVASPAAAINTIEPPEPNNMGTASLDFPITIPEGRQGIQPQLSIRYSNNSKNDWLGLGWNLQLQSISVETRWGVPRYIQDKESETYSLNGEQLWPVAHRTDFISRTEEKRFYPRVETNFDKIIRHGNSPKNYWWEVTDKSGVRYSYGGSSSLGGVSDSSVLRDDSENIAHWSLTEIRDLNENFVNYEYVIQEDKGVIGGTVPGYNVYINKITYTGHGNTQGKYQVQFIRDRNLGEQPRKDISINAQYGLKQVTADLLRIIQISFNGAPIRSYELEYKEGPFFKTLLNKITEYDASGKEFVHHEFEYFDDVNAQTEFRPFTPVEDWSTPNDHVRGDFINPTELFNDDASAMGGNKSKGFGLGMAVTVGPIDPNLAGKTATVGGTFNFSHSNSEGVLALVDIDGDGLPDKVFKEGDNLFYRPNSYQMDGLGSFADKRPIVGIGDFNKGRSNTFDIGVQAIGPLGSTAVVSAQTTRTKNTISTYFEDVNGDQLIDIVKDGKVYFNHINSNGNPSFTTHSSDTPSPISSSNGINSDMFENDPQELEENIDQFPLHDVVKTWEAPYSGNVSISAPVSLIPADEPARSADGVRVAIQLKDSELWSQTIEADDFGMYLPIGLSDIAINKGDRIYFRLQSLFNGLDDQVQWSPTITYVVEDVDLTDANGLPIFSYNASDDFIVTAPVDTGMPIDGTVAIEGTFSKPVTSDNVMVEIVNKNGISEDILWQKEYAWNEASNENIVLESSVIKDDNLCFKVKSKTNINWTSIDWLPRVYYTASSDTLVDSVTNDDGDPLFETFPVVDYSIYNKSLKRSLPWLAGQIHDTLVPTTDSLRIRPRLRIQQKKNSQETTNREIVFTIKKANELVFKNIKAPALPVFDKDTIFDIPYAAIKLPYDSSDQLYFEFHVENDTISSKIITSNVSLDAILDDAKIVSLETTETGLTSTIKDELYFGIMYRHWGQFAYNGNRDWANEPINESVLVLESNLTEPPEVDLSDEDSGEHMEMVYDSLNLNTPSADRFIYLNPYSGKKKYDLYYRGYDDLTYVKKDTISSSRMGEDELLPPDPGEGNNDGTTSAIDKVIKSRNRSFSAGIKLGLIGGSYSNGSSWQLNEFMDMNGDSYPDVISKNKIQYTLPTGGLEDHSTDHNFGDVQQSKNSGLGINTGSGGSIISGSDSSIPKSVKSSAASMAANTAFGINVSYSDSDDQEEFAWYDINGDGLPDRIYSGGDVDLNLGYRFAAKENWNFEEIGKGKAKDYGGGLGINLFGGSIVAGIGLSRSENVVERTLQDINGDGLMDYIHSVEPLMVALNTGNGFAQPIEWGENNQKVISKGLSTGESANAAFTACIPITPVTPVVKLCFNPSGGVNRGFNITRAQLRDINGDGFPDYIQSDKDDDLKIERSTIGRTNFLKTVQRPLGAKITMDYARVGNTYDKPNDIWALTSVVVHDGFEGDGINTTKKTFEYEEGLYNRHEREFYGFGIVKNHDVDESSNTIYRTTIQEFENDNFYEKGLLKREALQDAEESLFTKTENTYQLKDTETGSTLPETYKQNDAAGAFPAMTETKKLFYEGEDSPKKSTRMVYDYDVLGNIKTYRDFGDFGGEDDYVSNIMYHQIPSVYSMNVPKGLTVTGNGKTFRKQQSEIDSNTGKIIKIRSQLENGDEAEYDMDYDDFGNLSKITRPENASGERFFYEYQYDPEVQTFVTEITDAYGYNSSTEYDYRFGKIILDTDINGQQIKYQIDGLGRITSITGPFELATGHPYSMLFEYHPESEVPWARTKRFDPQHRDNDLETIMFLDGLKRNIQKKEDAVISMASQSEGEEQMIVSGLTNYDAFGRAEEEYYPITEPKGNESTINNEVDPITPTKKTYDVLDRILTITLPDAALTSYSYGFGTDRDGHIQFSKKVTDPNGIWKENFVNVRGLTTAIKEQYGEGSDIWTSYSYNAINELEEIKDDQDNRIGMKYDWLGRREEVVHPDAGTTKFRFDLANNLSKKITANLKASEKEITYDYEFERLIGISYPENIQNNVTFSYGEPGAEHNRAGHIVLQEDATGAQEFFYSPLGSITKNIRTIVVPFKNVLTYTTEWTFDTWNRVTEMTYPDKEKIIYNYDLGGKLQSISGLKGGTDYNYLSGIGYNKFEQYTFQNFGNGTQTSYTYEPERRRLASMVLKAKDGRKLMDNRYTYDKADNILRLQNKADTPSANQMGGETDANYIYDDLYRLTKAIGIHSNGNQGHRYVLEMGYNSINNILSKNQAHEMKSPNSEKWVKRGRTSYQNEYEYNDEQPHAPIQIGDRTYTYDANGNLTGSMHNKSGQERQILWDEENRIMAIADNGAMFNYVYDADNERVLKSHGGGQTVSVNGSKKASNGSIGNYTIYVNPFVVVRNSMVTKHLYVEHSRIVTKLAESNEGLLQERAGSKIKHINFSQKQTQLKGSLFKTYSDMGLEIEEFEDDTNAITPPLKPTNKVENNTLGNVNTLNDSRILERRKALAGNGLNQEAFVYYYHPDHLGSSAYITDANGQVSQHLEYFPSGETFVEEHSNTHRTPYLYNGKELDDETGLYYYGARYYDPKTGIWQSVDPPILNEYLDGSSNDGVFNPSNLGVYAYVQQNPIKLLDPNGAISVKAMATFHTEKIKEANRTTNNDLVLWTGPGAKEAAEAHTAKNNNSITLGESGIGQAIEGMGQVNERYHSKDTKIGGGTQNPYWDIESANIAKTAKGKVGVYMHHTDKSRFEKSVFFNTEFSQLEKSGATSIEFKMKDNSTLTLNKIGDKFYHITNGNILDAENNQQINQDNISEFLGFKGN